MKRERADLLLVRKGLVSSRERARAAILAGEVRADGTRVAKAGQQIGVDAELDVASGSPYVSRGGAKLAHALDVFDVHPAGLVAMDVGASTGGFTDCLLKQGAAKVFAIDVGYGQLAWSLRNDPRVVAMERTNVRYLDPAKVGTTADIITVDVSFISVRKLLDRLVQLLGPDGMVLVLVKPQFEGERTDVGKGGVVRDAAVHRRVLESLAAAVESAGLSVRGLAYSPITGADGNIEFWLNAARPMPSGHRPGRLSELVERVVREAHAALG